MRQFLVDPKDVSDKHLVIRREEARHMTAVLRMKPGDDFWAADGNGVRYHCRIERAGRDEIQAGILGHEPQDKSDGRNTIGLFVALSKPQVMENILKGGTELGVDRFLFFPASRSVTGYPSDNRILRWNKIIREAAKQSRRRTLPILELKKDFNQAVSLAKDFDIAVIGALAAPRVPIGQIAVKFRDMKRWACMIGPEGDFTDEEVKSACSYGWKRVSLGWQILRVETAALYTVAKLV